MTLDPIFRPGSSVLNTHPDVDRSDETEKIKPKKRETQKYTPKDNDTQKHTHKNKQQLPQKKD